MLNNFKLLTEINTRPSPLSCPFCNVGCKKHISSQRMPKTTSLYISLPQKYIPLTQRRYHHISNFFFNLSGLYDNTLAIVNHQRGVRIGIDHVLFQQNAKISMQPIVNYAFHVSPKKKPAMNEERKCVQKLVEFAVSYLSHSDFFQAW